METQEIEKMVITPKIPKLVITMGDPSSIGPEVILKALGQMTAEGRAGAAAMVDFGHWRRRSRLQMGASLMPL